MRVNPVRAEVVGPVPERLEAEIEAFLHTDPRYADFPFMHFRVQTNNSFATGRTTWPHWAFLPVGDRPEPLMFVSRTGRGTGGTRCGARSRAIPPVH